jgi:hypothetical protein
LANSAILASLTELLCNFFFEERRNRHSGGMSPNEELTSDLLRVIRLKVQSGELD